MASFCRTGGLLGIVVTALAAGCAVKNPPAPATALGSVLPSSTTMPDAWTAASGPAGAALQEWVRTFADPQLDALVDEALRNNLDLQAVAARVEIAADFITQARSLLFPQVFIAGGVGAVGRDGTRDRSGIAGEISWGRVRYDVGATNLLDVLELQARQLDTRLELIKVHADRLSNRVALYLALGGGFTAPPRP